MKLRYCAVVCLSLLTCSFGQTGHAFPALDADNKFASPPVNQSASSKSTYPAGVTYATTEQNWSLALTTPLTGCPTGIRCVMQSVALPAGISGVDVTTGLYEVYISDSSPEAIKVAGGTYTFASGGTITFVPYYGHTSYTAGSASSGIQETINAACGTSATTYFNSQCNVVVPANGGPTNNTLVRPWNTYNVYGTIYFHSLQSSLSGYGASLNCLAPILRGACIQLGDLVNSNDFGALTVSGFSFRTPYAPLPSSFSGVAIASTATASGVRTITTAKPHGFHPGDMVTIMFTDDHNYWGDAVVSTVPTATSFTYKDGRSDTISLQTTPGVVALAFVAVVDNAGGSHLIDLSSDYLGNHGYFNNFFDFWDDESATIDHFNNNAIALNHGANWTGSFVFSGGAGNIGHQLAPVITLRDSTITANYSNCATDYNSNGLYIENTVCQASGPWEVYSSNTTGNYQGAYLKNIYSESTIAANPLSPAKSPFPGLGIAGLIAGASTGAANFQIAGSGGTGGGFAAGGSGSTPYSYFIVANDCPAGYNCVLNPVYQSHTSPMQVLNWLSTGNDSIPVRWPRIANGSDVITYDVIRIKTPAGVGAVYPYNGGCLGGPGGTCGYVATGLSQGAACSGGLVCTYTDSGSSSTSAYTIKQANYGGNLNFWPGSLVSVNRSVKVDIEETGIVGVGLNGNPLQMATQCSNYGVASPGGYSTCLASITASNNSVPNQTATILSDGAEVSGGMSLSKGRLNFTTTIGAALTPHHIITLIDSQPTLTQATWGYRPAASGNDTWIGTDVPSGGARLSSGQLAFGSPVSITNYIGQTGDGVHANWSEKLTSTTKTFAVPVRFVPVEFSSLPRCAPETEGMQASVKNSTTNTWGATVTGGGPNHILAYCDGSNWTVAAK